MAQQELRYRYPWCASSSDLQLEAARIVRLSGAIALFYRNEYAGVLSANMIAVGHPHTLVVKKVFDF